MQTQHLLSPEEQIRATMPATYDELAKKYVKTKKLVHGLIRKVQLLSRGEQLKQALEENDGDVPAVLLEQQVTLDKLNLAHAEIREMLYAKLEELGVTTYRRHIPTLIYMLIEAYEDKLRSTDGAE